MENSSYSKLIEDSIKLHFERNGILDEMRSGLHVKVLNMMRGETDLKKEEPLCGGDMRQRGLVQLLNYLVVDYFAWYGYKHTLETFALETGDRCQLKPRERLQREFGDNFAQKDLPILLQMVMKQAKHINAKNLPQSPQQVNLSRRFIETVPQEKDIPPEGNPSKMPNSPSPRVEPSKGPTEGVPSKGPKTATRKDVKQPQAKVNVRKAMADSSKLPSTPPRMKRVKKPATTAKKTRYSSEYESSSRCTTESGSGDDSSDDSDAFAAIPNRYYYREQEPPEQAYQNGFGEEGPYEMPSQSTVRRPLRPRGLGKRKPLKIVEMRDDTDKEKPQSSSRDTTNKNAPAAKDASAKTTEQNTSKRTIFQSLMAVSKPKCPETMVGSMQETSDDSPEDSDEYI
ncbi:uncharacterized protein LOC108651142 [Drosophila navojoa]|nr:uncharacterized protein LOC108651142 [Drosophila navojoa]